MLQLRKERKDEEFVGILVRISLEQQITPKKTAKKKKKNPKDRDLN